MFRPPEYAALIDPGFIAFGNYPDPGQAVDLYFKRMVEKALLPENNIAWLLGLGPKDWSPIGEYKFKRE